MKKRLKFNFDANGKMKQNSNILDMANRRAKRSEIGTRGTETIIWGSFVLVVLKGVDISKICT